MRFGRRWGLLGLLFGLTAPLAAQTAGAAYPTLTSLLPELRALVGQTNAQIRAAQTWLDRREADFGRGLGWLEGQGATAPYGVDSWPQRIWIGPAGISFEKDELRRPDNQSVQTRLFWNRQPSPDGLQWLSWENLADRSSLVIGLRPGRGLESLQWKRADGLVLDVWARGWRLTWPDPTLWYTYYLDRETPGIGLSPALAERLFRPAAGPAAGDFLRQWVRETADAADSLDLARLLDRGTDLSDQTAVARDLTTAYRRASGVGAAVANDRLAAAALSHSRYGVQAGVPDRLQHLKLGGEASNAFLVLHDETPGQPGFTGRTPDARARAAGYTGGAGEVANFGVLLPWSSLTHWYLSIYHRRPFLDPRAAEFGYAGWVGPGEANAVWTMDWGYSGTPATELLTVPGRGEVDVPWAWNGYEAPDPHPERQKGPQTTGPNPQLRGFGTPLTILVPDAARQGGRLSLVGPGGRAIPLLTPGPLPDPLFVEASAAVPLEPGTTYTATYTWKGGAYSWTFTTVAASATWTDLQALIRSVDFPAWQTLKPLDRAAAAQALKAPGRLVTSQSGGQTWVESRKLGFKIRLPEGYQIEAARDWEEVILKNPTTKRTLRFGAWNYSSLPDFNQTLLALRPKWEYPLLRQTELPNPLRTGVLEIHSAGPGWEISFGFIQRLPYALLMYAEGPGADLDLKTAVAGLEWPLP